MPNVSKPRLHQKYNVILLPLHHPMNLIPVLHIQSPTVPKPNYHSIKHPTSLSFPINFFLCSVPPLLLLTASSYFNPPNHPCLLYQIPQSTLLSPPTLFISPNSSYLTQYSLFHCLLCTPLYFFYQSLPITTLYSFLSKQSITNPKTYLPNTSLHHF
ncbi:hypothetical protein BB559_007555 [Furculomyces boomerangus]|uniref:Uncharacterized protein n=1 Tax=Furculomyces boomerangus TaxID=61424 RepID=A0A2T9XWW8_9FUNG|nr:hypothetical protein BB559_007555 [Furculomyces boomerangus]